MRQVLGLFALVMALCFAPSLASAQTFEVGQVWTLQAPMAETARVRVGRVEEGGQTVHISLWGQPTDAPGMASPLIASHLPISAEALSRSVGTLVDDAPPADLQFEEGYASWHSAQGGVFTITVNEIVGALTEMMTRQLQPQQRNRP